MQFPGHSLRRLAWLVVLAACSGPPAGVDGGAGGGGGAGDGGGSAGFGGSGGGAGGSAGGTAGGSAGGTAGGSGGGTAGGSGGGTAGGAAGGAGGGAVIDAGCIPRVTPRGVTALDSRGRVLNARGVHLTDWDGFVANPSETVTLKPPADVAFPITATVRADHQRLYFDLPSTVSATGPAKTVQFASAQSTVAVRVGIIPDRDGADEQYTLTLTLGGADPRPETLPISVHDQDTGAPLRTRILLDFTQDKTGLMADAGVRAVIAQAADDWAWFLDDPPFDPVPRLDESTWIWRPDGGFAAGDVVQNDAGYTGFLLYAYGIHSTLQRSGGEGSFQGKPQTSGGAMLPLRRSGGLEVETHGNYNVLGWSVSLAADDWWKTGNLGNEVNDLYSIVHHEMGHAHGFNTAYGLFTTAKMSGGLSSAALTAYLGGPLAIDASDHFNGRVDPSSGFGAFGNEYNGVMPRKRWIITRTDLLALEAMGYRLRPLSFATWDDAVPECP